MIILKVNNPVPIPDNLQNVWCIKTEVMHGDGIEGNVSLEKI